MGTKKKTSSVNPLVRKRNFVRICFLELEKAVKEICKTNPTVLRSTRLDLQVFGKKVFEEIYEIRKEIQNVKEEIKNQSVKKKKG